MRHVYPAPQVAHLWANQSQDNARTPSDNFYFSGPRIYSYGAHYLLGELHTLPGIGRVALINSRDYSATTRKHQSLAVTACTGLIPYYYASDPSDPETALPHLEDKICKVIEGFWSQLKPKYYEIDMMAEAVSDYNKLAHVLERGDLYIELDADTWHAMREYVEYRDSVNIKLDETAQERKRERMAQRIRDFKDGTFTPRSPMGLTPQLVRVRDGLIESSDGASVALSDAVTVFDALMRGEDIAGRKVGHFSVDYANDQQIKIGCHLLDIKEIRKVLEREVTSD